MLVVDIDRHSRKDFDHGNGPWIEELQRFIKSGHLHLDDEAESHQDFLLKAVGRAFPPVPSFRGFTLSAKYVFQDDVLNRLMDPSDYDYRERDVPPERRMWVVAEMESRNAWTCVGPLFSWLERRHPGFGGWLCNAIDSPFTISPRTYLDWLSQAHWMGESDEGTSKAEYDLNCEDGDEFPFPTRKEFDALIPAWAREHQPQSPAKHRKFLKLAAKLFDVDCSPLFTPSGRRVKLDTCQPHADYDARMRAVMFGWRDNDMVIEAVDYCFNCAMQSTQVVDTCFAVVGDNHRTVSAELTKAWRALTVYDQLVGAFDRYRKEHKIV